MQKKEILYGMVGGGPGAFIGAAHRQAIRLDDSAKLAAGCFSRDFKKTEQMGVELCLDNNRLYRTAEEMAEAEGRREDGIRFVVIVTPNAAHFSACKAFLNAGIHVVCDKPLTLEIAEAEELCQLARQKGLLFCVTYTYSGHVAVKQAEQLVVSGAIGEVRMVAAEYPQSWLAEENAEAWRMQPEVTGCSNCMGDIGTHIENTVYRITHLSIQRVLAKLDRLVTGRKLDDNGVVMVEYENGASGVYWASQVARGHANGLRIRIYGSKGSLFWAQEHCNELELATEDGRTIKTIRGDSSILPLAARYQRLPAGHNEGFLEALANIYVSFTECLRKKDEGVLSENEIDFPTAEDGLQGIRFVHACVESSEKGNIWVSL